MILWRISNYATLDGSGGLYASGRWHTRGRPIIYCARNPATALLETLVHLEIDAEDRPERFQLLKIEGPDGSTLEQVKASALPGDWAENILATQAIGNQWLAEQRTLLLEVPSVLAPETWNVLINPQHREFGGLKIAATFEHPFDARFFS